MKPVDLVRGLRRDAAFDPAALDRGKAALMAAIRREAAPARRPTIVPQVPYGDVGAALSFLARAFGFREIRTARLVSADGAIDQAEAERQHAERARWFAALKEVVGARPEDGPADVLPLVLRRLARSPAEHLLVNVEDLWGETASQNAPGTVTDENWTLRAAYPLEAWETLPGLEALLASLLRERRTAAPRRGNRWVTPHSERHGETHGVGGNEWPT